MDPICHTMFGAALASTGLERKTRFGRATLILGANLPDVDVISYAWGETTALGFRRGITHGVLALIVLPFLLAGVMMVVGRLSRRGSARSAADFKWLLALSAISVVSHSTLDALNVYGVRWLMPFDDTWFYGDVLYIVDPWMWAILAVALIAARWQKHCKAPHWFARPACVGLLVAFAYVIAMAAGESISRQVVEASLGDAEIPRMMIAPVPFDPFRRAVVIDGESAYRLGVVNLLPLPRFRLDERRIPKGESAAARLASATGDGRAFLLWARFPFFEVGDSKAEAAVYIIDARYTLDRDASFGSVRIPLSTARAKH
ncbi:MAG: metal-dependent hydrolase [Myxococcales bacterium]|nr:metal-dependent hydrolase [Myxococcales bacterium]